MKLNIAFDVYGTLIDTNDVFTLLKEIVGEKASEFSTKWREKQLEYSFRRGLMGSYVDFSICTREALNYTCKFYDINLSDESKKNLLEKYKYLSAYSDVEDSMKELKRDKHKIYAFSNGRKSAVSSLLEKANLLSFFDGIVSCNDIQMFKPSPKVYQHLLNEINGLKDNTWLVSSNPFDILGADHFGLSTAWINRNSSVFDPWGVEPNIIVSSLTELKNRIKE